MHLEREVIDATAQFLEQKIDSYQKWSGNWQARDQHKVEAYKEVLSVLLSTEKNLVKKPFDWLPDNWRDLRSDLIEELHPDSAGFHWNWKEQVEDFPEEPEKGEARWVDKYAAGFVFSGDHWLPAMF